MQISCLASAPPEEINARLGELDQEWDIERVLEANAAGFSLVGLLLGISAGRKWRLLPVAAAGFLMQHATQGWCPPVFGGWVSEPWKKFILSGRLLKRSGEISKA